MGNCIGMGITRSPPSSSTSITSTNPSNPPPPPPAKTTSSTTTHSDLNKSDSYGTTSGSSAGKSQFSAVTTDPGEHNSSMGNLINPVGHIHDSPDLKVFRLADLKAATKNFKPDTFLGQGGFGMVYKGWIDHETFTPSKSTTGMLVAVKKLNPESGSGQGVRQWKSEIQFLRRQSHPNLVKLIGYCCENGELLLVYEFMQKGSLENHLFGSKSLVEPLPWDTRIKIILGAARGLTFLHSAEEHIIYRDFKASNILLDENYNAKISDFGLARFGPSGGDSHVSTEAIGTHGYAAPEYIHTGHLYVKSDVYGFGVVLLEMMTGYRAFDRARANGRQNLVDWMKPQLQKKKVKSIMDGKLEGQYSKKAASLAANITLKCIEEDPKNRPSMQEVVHVLEQIQDMSLETMSYGQRLL